MDSSLLHEVVEAAIRAGADAAEAVGAERSALSVNVRLGELEEVEREEGRDLGLRVFVGQRQAAVAGSDLSPAARARLVERAVAMARLAPEDPYCGLAPSERLSRGPTPDLDLFDPTEPTAAQMEAQAAAADRGPQLDPHQTFETFVVGSSNQLAHAAMCRVADAAPGAGVLRRLPRLAQGPAARHHIGQRLRLRQRASAVPPGPAAGHGQRKTDPRLAGRAPARSERAQVPARSAPRSAQRGQPDGHLCRRNDLEQLRTILDSAAEQLFEHLGSGSIAGFDRGFGVKWIHKKVA